MVMDISTDSDLMKKENIAVGYDIFTGNVDDNHEANKQYREIHTGGECILMCILVTSGYLHGTGTVLSTSQYFYK